MKVIGYQLRHLIPFNIIGTLNVLHSCSFLKNKVNFISITTDKCYENNEDGRNFNELDAMGGKDPYSASKACTEIVVKSYALSFEDKNNLDICTARAGNIIGGGDWCKDRIVTDVVSSIINKRYFNKKSQCHKALATRNRCNNWIFKAWCF